MIDLHIFLLSCVIQLKQTDARILVILILLHISKLSNAKKMFNLQSIWRWFKDWDGFSHLSLETGLRPETLLKRDSNTGVFSVNNTNILRTAFFVELLRWVPLHSQPVSAQYSLSIRFEKNQKIFEMF